MKEKPIQGIGHTYGPLCSTQGIAVRILFYAEKDVGVQRNENPSTKAFTLR